MTDISVNGGERVNIIIIIIISMCAYALTSRWGGTPGPNYNEEK